MGLGDALSETLSGMLGNVEKAIIKVVDDGDSEEDAEIRLDVADSSTSGAADHMFSAYMGSDDIRKKAIGALSKMHTDTEQLFSSGKQFTVQFNPSTLHLRASGGGRTEIKNFAKKQEDGSQSPIDLTYAPVPFSIHMDVDLVFNKVDPNDAFIELAPSLGTIKGAYKSVANLLGKNSNYSVQNEIEGLIATTRCFRTCLLSFNWGKLCYSGVLQNLEATYTVFNPKGEPVAGTVHLSMILVDGGVNERNMGKWYEAYQKAFQENEKSSSILSKLGSSAFTNFTF